MRLVIEVSDTVVNGQSIDITPSAVKRARLDFNPSGREDVTRIKILAAAFYAELERISQKEPREAATAATHIQAGAMFAVSAATAS